MPNLVIWAPLILLGAQASEDPGRAAEIAAFLGNEVSAVVHFDLEKLNLNLIKKHLPSTLIPPDEANQLIQSFEDPLKAIKNAGGKHVYLLVDPTRFTELPVIIVPGLNVEQQKEMTRLLTSGQPPLPLRWPRAEVMKNAVVAGSPSVLKELREQTPTERPDLLASLQARDEAAVLIALAPSKTLRRAVEESTDRLPAELGGAPITTLTQELGWASIALSLDPTPVVQIVVDSARPEGVQALQALVDTLRKLGVEALKREPGAEQVGQLLSRITPKVEGELLTLSTTAEDTATLISVPFRKIQAARHRVQCVNNLKMLGLAMHNYASNHRGSFPPAYTTNPDGKPLLSWRVLILPYLEEKSLYDQFKLDEPWDSPHNKMLVSRIPKFYVCPACSPKLKQEGRTTYVVPRGDATIFPGSKSVSLKEITDGTSNTILTLEVSEPKGVVWTQPEDWDTERDKNSRPMFGTHAGGTNTGVADGSVHFVRDKVGDATFKKLFTRNGGEVIGSDEY